MKNLKRSALGLSILIALLCLCSCSKGDVRKIENSDGDKVIGFGTGKFKRQKIDGVDCIIGSGNYDSAAAISCDWANKDK